MEVRRAIVSDDCAHLAGELAEIAREEAFVLPVEARRRQKLLAVEVGANAHFNPLNVPHENEALFLVELRQTGEERDDISAVIEPAHEALCDFVELHHIAPRLLAHETDRLRAIREGLN